MEFSKSRWLARAARNKHNRAGWSRPLVTALERVIKWIEARGYTVQFHSRGHNAWLTPDKVVLIPSKPPAWLQLIYILHEAGHVSVECSKPTKRFNRGYAAPTKYRQLNHLVDVLDEELAAWDIGLKLAARLGIEIDEERYNKRKVTSIRGYAHDIAKWTLRRKFSERAKGHPLRKNRRR